MLTPESTPNNHAVEPPRSLGRILMQMGPGLIIAGSIVGSGELISTTKTGAQSGVTLLWLILFGCIIKVFAQVEIGRHTILTGQSSLRALNSVPGKIGPINFILWTWIAMMLVSVVQLGGIVGGVGQSLAIACPVTRDYINAIAIPSKNELKHYIKYRDAIDTQHESFTTLADEDQTRIRRGIDRIEQQLSIAGSPGEEALKQMRENGNWADPYTYDDKLWALIMSVLTSYLLYAGSYSLLQNLTTAFVFTFTLVTIGNVVALQFTPSWSVSSQQIIEGLSFKLPPKTSSSNPLSTALDAFGVIGVGAAELIQYPYWCLEKGYAKHVGYRDNSEAWATRATGWIKIMMLDSFLSMIVYTIATVAFLILGASVLYPEGLDPDGMRMVSTLAAAYRPIFGFYASWLFLLGAFCVLFSTFLVANAGHAHTLADFFSMLGWRKETSEEASNRNIATWGAVLPMLNFAMYCTGANPVRAILLAGMMQALLLPMIGIGTLMFRYSNKDPRFKPALWWDICLILSVLSFITIASWTLYEKGRYLLSLLA
ncbi:NRAMP family divalent metal transporter [Lacunimicrobium album]